MAAINIACPNVEGPAGTVGVVALKSYTVSSHVKDGDIVVLNAGTIATAGSNPTAVLGLATHDSDANYGGTPSPGPAPLQNVFGVSQVGSPLVPASPGQTLVAPFANGSLMDINVSATTGWITGGTQQVNIGSLVGFTIDGPTGFWVADPTASNQIAVIDSLLVGPGFTTGFNAASNINGNGDTGVRVRVRVLAADTQG